jgi:hypothetical protein
VGFHLGHELSALSRIVGDMGPRTSADRPPQVSVIGVGRPDEEAEALAEEVGRLLAKAGVRVVCGGLGGVMSAVAKGASEAGGEVIGIVPSADPADANPYCTHVIATGIGKARNLAVVASGEAVIAIGGQWGTLSEIAHAREFGRPVVALASWRVEPHVPIAGGEGIEPAETPEHAVSLALSAIGRRAASL